MRPRSTIDHADATDSLVINGLGGKDTINAAALSAAAIKLTLDGGGANDKIFGGKGDDLLLGGDGSDFIDGNQGNDIAFLGAGDDVFQWDPGDGSDVVEGQAGTDTMLFNGSNTSENFDILANGGRVLFLRNVANITMDLDDVETIRLNALGGSDNTVVGDLTGTDVTKVAIDLAAVDQWQDRRWHARQRHRQRHQRRRYASPSPPVGKQIVVDGLSAQVTIAHADATDRLVVNGLGGDDLIDASGLKAGKIDLQIFGGLGKDVVIGSAGNDTVNGGDGDDVALLGAGDDVFIWNPGDDNDVVEGQAGTDAMVFNGANIAENIDIAANGGRVLFFRDIANVTMDLNDVETVHFNALGGADKINVGDLTGTDAKLVAIDLAGVIGGATGDSQPDTVTVNGTNGEDVVSISALGSKVVVDGLSAQVTADHTDADDKLVINAFAGDDIIDASTLAAGKATLQLLGGAGDDVILGSAGDDLIDGGAGDDVVFGNAGSDTFRYSDPLDGHDHRRRFRRRRGRRPGCAEPRCPVRQAGRCGGRPSRPRLSHRQRQRGRRCHRRGRQRRQRLRAEGGHLDYDRCSYARPGRYPEQLIACRHGRPRRGTGAGDRLAMALGQGFPESPQESELPRAGDRATLPCCRTACEGSPRC